MKVLIACEYSGRVREAFRKLGHDAWSCDLLQSDDNSDYHITGDAVALLSDGWDLLVAHPPCTYLANSGVCHLHTDASRWDKLDDGAALFKAFLDAPIRMKAIENPIMHKYAKERTGCGKPTQIIQPWMFGHMETKATCLWMDGLLPLVPTTSLKAETMALPANVRQRLHYLPPSPTRWKERSTTYQGIADAMASQWGAKNAEENT